MTGKQFGAKLTKQQIGEYESSPNWKHGEFQNLECTPMEFSLRDMPRMLYKQFTPSQNKTPKSPLKVLKLKSDFNEGMETKMVWYGHSVMLIRMNGMNILIDPMFGPNAAPISPFPAKRFSQNTLDIIDELPEIDLVLQTHDHYDHLDLASIKKLKGKVKKFFVALGVKRHLVHWGVDEDSIQEFDWWDQQELGGIHFHFTPTRHFSGRGLKDRFKSLWGGWVLKGPNENIWFSGDGGYGKHFAEIGNRLGPFDFAMMECGQYNDDWPLIHLFPEQAIQAAIDAKAKKVMPVHWAGFSLSYQHNWYEPAVEFKRHAMEKGIEFLLPRIGEEFQLNSHFQLNWWEMLG